MTVNWKINKLFIESSNKDSLPKYYFNVAQENSYKIVVKSYSKIS